jgi:hypothetical protein
MIADKATVHARIATGFQNRSSHRIRLGLAVVTESFEVKGARRLLID